MRTVSGSAEILWEFLEEITCGWPRVGWAGEVLRCPRKLPDGGLRWEGRGDHVILSLGFLFWGSMFRYTVSGTLVVIGRLSFHSRGCVGAE